MPNVFGIDFQYPPYVSASHRSWWSCRRRHALGTGLRLRPKARTSSGSYAPRLVGSLVHDVLAAWYKEPLENRDVSKLESWAKSQAMLDDWPQDIITDAMPKALEILRKFGRKFGNDGIVAKHTEHQIQVEIGDVNFLGFIDMVYEQNDRIVVEEWKTSQTKIEPLQYTMRNPQVLDYLWSARQYIWPNQDVVLSYLFITPYYCQRVMLPEFTPRDQFEDWAQLTRERNTLAPVPNYGYHCGGCDFNKLCEVELTGGDVQSALRDYKREEPNGA